MDETVIACRAGCGACCIAPSISSIPGMGFKPAGVRCIHLLEDFRCGIFGEPARPAVCASLRPTVSMCGESRDEALSGLLELERLTRPE